METPRHYAGMPIQPIEYIEANSLDFNEGNIVKYISRWRNKGGLEDLLKAQFYINRIIALAKAEQAQEPEQVTTPACDSILNFNTLQVKPTASGAIRLHYDMQKMQEELNKAQTFKIDFTTGFPKTDTMGRPLQAEDK